MSKKERRAMVLYRCPVCGTGHLSQATVNRHIKQQQRRNKTGR